MKLHFKKTSKKAITAMSEATAQTDLKSKQNYIKSAEREISSVTRHEHVKVLNSGNSAILAAMSSFKGKIMIPDQGGWTGFQNAAQFLGLEILEVPTELGIINPNTLEEFIYKHKPESLFITSFAGYIAEQHVKDLFDVCEDNNVFLVEDASGGIGDSQKKLANGDHAHIIVASTGSPKIVNVGSGGFISTNNNEFFKKSKFLLKSLKADPVTCAGITEEIKNASSVLEKAIDSALYIKEKLDNTIHQNKRGISVALETTNPKKTGYLLRNALRADGRSIITVCPRYERLLMDAICIEVKNLDLSSMETNTLDEIIKIINDTIN